MSDEKSESEKKKTTPVLRKQIEGLRKDDFIGKMTLVQDEIAKAKSLDTVAKMGKEKWKVNDQDEKSKDVVTVLKELLLSSTNRHRLKVADLTKEKEVLWEKLRAAERENEDLKHKLCAAERENADLKEVVKENATSRHSLSERFSYHGISDCSRRNGSKFFVVTTSSLVLAAKIG